MAKRHKYRIIKNADNKDESKVIKEKISKTEAQRWLHSFASTLTEHEKRDMLYSFYDKHINDHPWHLSIVNFLLVAAIDNKFLKVVDNPIIVKHHKIYLITEEESTKDKD